eukprot:snap_masked-scaffold_4-processed-gene-1.30-mRNA-1 protein AED:1.00 eAED:1.00 QI:0/0/0/0/1/1/2/0/357
MLNNEQKAAVALFSMLGGYTLIFKKQIFERRNKILKEANGKKNVVPTTTDKIQDHPLVAWLLSNIGAIGTAFIVRKIQILLGEPRTPLTRYLRVVFRNLLGQDLLVAYCYFLTNYVYKHIPHFSPRSKIQTLPELIMDYSSCNFTAVIGFSVLEAFVFNDAIKKGNLEFTQRTGITFDNWYALKPTHLLQRPFMFILKVWFTRMTTDFFFWLFHRALHLRSVYWLHKKHHEHVNPHIKTNYHFLALDLTLEAQLPILLAFILMEVIFPKDVFTDNFEGDLISYYLVQLEVLSHAGKAVPTMSLVPPIAPALFKFDDWNPWFHELHHNVLKCNYSITPFWDWLFGTASRNQLYLTLPE